MTRNLIADGWSVDLLDEVDSTNSYALRSPVPWRLVAAHAQTAGRGRLERTWQVPAGAAVTVSMTLPMPMRTSAWGWVPLFVGDAVRAAIASVADEASRDDGMVDGSLTDEPTPGGSRVATKWPNDVLVRECDGEWRKVCGVLCQVVPGPEHLVVAGVGVNVTQTREQLPVPEATSLALADIEVSRDELLLRIARQVGASARIWASDDEGAVAALQQRVRSSCRTLGSEIDVHTPDGRTQRRHGSSIDDVGRLVTIAPGSRPGAGPTMVYSVADVVHARIAE